MRWIRFAPWVLCLLFVANCGEKTAAPQSGAVGHVSSIEGKASAQRNDEPERTLVLNDIIYAEDTIRTSAESSVRVSLTHNGANWSIPENTTRKVRESKAFKAKKSSSTLAAKSNHGTSAAGRNTEREAGDTVATLARRPQEDKAIEATAGPSPKFEDREAAPSAPAAAEPPPPPPPPTKTADRADKNRKGTKTRRSRKAKPPAGRGGGQNLSAPMKPSPAIAAETAPGRSFSMDNRPADDEEADMDEAEPAPAVRPTSAQKQHLGKLLKTCRATHSSGSGTLHFSWIGGRISVSAKTAALAPLAACLQTAARTSPPPGPKTTTGLLRVR